MVAPLVGAWIEIRKVSGFLFQTESLLSWERGLKLLYVGSECDPNYVAPLVGAWIEIDE